jgi:hypothetical protein
MSLFRAAALLNYVWHRSLCCWQICNPTQLRRQENPAPDDIPKSIAESVSGTLQFAEGNFLGVAEAMPEDKYSYIPAGGKFDGVRSLGEQVKHVACAQFAFDEMLAYSSFVRPMIFPHRACLRTSHFSCEQYNSVHQTESAIR